MPWDSGRTTFNSNKIVILDTSSYFVSYDFLKLFKSLDLGLGIQKRLTLDFDGNLRLYSLDEKIDNWTVTWQAMADPCRVHGLCGPNSICSYGSSSSRGCSCLPGHKIKNQSDWSYGCELEHNLPDNDRKASFVQVDHMELYGYEYDVSKNSTLESFKEMCLQTLICKGFLFKFENGVYNCYAKSQLLNGKHSQNLLGTLYVKLNPNNSGLETQGYFLVATAFKKFTYVEMKRATRGFSEEIGRGGHGVVYKGIFPDHQIAAIKRLNEANEGEAEFLAEGVAQNSSFSKIRGTRGYMALEWVFNLPITSKVDVYSYGIVVLMITGRSPTGVRDAVEGEEEERCERLETWVRKNMNG
ncbi:hypothetical protein CsSME_00013937 [Camellia sinensis var. sinensis]